MCDKGLLFVFVIIFGRSSAISHCDRSTTGLVPEGNLRQSGNFNWLGVFKVHLHDADADTAQVAMTGIVLIKIKHAIANADDIVRIPERIFLNDAQAMFLPASNTPWYVRPTSYVAHPEYEYSTTNSIAIIELNIDEADSYPLNPICLPSLLFNSSSHLYLAGYTDENKLLEKVMYKIQYLPLQACEEFYHRAGLSDKGREPATYICGYAKYNVTQCIWDNGMALVSNATGWFNLIGLGIRGPGCAAPARFINMHPYFSWIESVTSEDNEMYDSPDYRRQDSNEFIPAHELFIGNSSRREFELDTKPDLMRDYEPYPFDVEKPRHFNIEPYDTDHIAVFPFNETMEMYKGACSQQKALLYREYFEVKADTVGGSVTYKLSLYDLLRKECICVLLSVECVSREYSILAFKEAFHFDSGTQLTESGETPEELFRYFPIVKPTFKPKNDTKWKPGPNLKPQFIKQGTRFGIVANYDLYIKYDFMDRAVLKFEMFATLDLLTTSTPSSTSTTNGTSTTAAKRRKGHRLWGMNKGDKSIKEPVITLVAEHAVVQETVSKGCLNKTFNTLVFGQLLLCLCLKKYLE